MSIADTLLDAVNWDSDTLPLSESLDWMVGPCWETSLGEEEDPFPLGWRYVHGRRIPLSPYDVRHPLDEDFIVNGNLHEKVIWLLLNSFRARLFEQTEVVSSLRTDWEIVGFQPIGSDIGVYEGFSLDPTQNIGTLRVGHRCGRTRLVMEVTSESTRDDDLDFKVDYYHGVRAEKYVIVDLLAHPRQVFGYELIDDDYRRMPLDERGRIVLREIGNFSMGFDADGHFKCWDATTGELLRNLRESEAALKETKDALEETKDALEETKDALEETKDALEETKDALEETKNALDKSQLARKAAEEKAQNAETSLKDLSDQLTKEKQALADQLADYQRRLALLEGQSTTDDASNGLSPK